MHYLNFFIKLEKQIPLKHHIFLLYANLQLLQSESLESEEDA